MIKTNGSIDFDKYKWQEFDIKGEDGIHIHMEQTILAYDRELGSIEFLTRWGTDGGFCPVHRHVGSTSCIVLEGEQHFYDYDHDKRCWSTKPRIRKAGEHGFSAGDDKMAHRECAGPDGCVAFFSMRGVGPDAVMYEAYDDDMNPIMEVTLDMLVADFEANAK